MKKFDGLLRGEIKKVESFAKKRDGRDSRITGYGYHEAKGADGFLVVKCEICSNDMRDREDDVSIFFTSRTGDDLSSARRWICSDAPPPVRCRKPAGAFVSSCCTPSRCIFVQYVNCVLYLAGV